MRRGNVLWFAATLLLSKMSYAWCWSTTQRPNLRWNQFLNYRKSERLHVYRFAGWTGSSPQPHGYARTFRRSMAQWSIGDLVVIPSKENALGKVVEAKGRGWYTVQLGTESNNVLFKARGTQLKAQESADIVSSIAKEFGPAQTSLLERPPPQPTMINLDSAIQTLTCFGNTTIDSVKNEQDRIFLQQVAHHATYSKWVVFTDLHCAPSTLQTTLEVLQKVNALAEERGAGVLFLGDWWHHRGSLRVDCLNEVLRALSTWTVPMILIPGNHDQITVGGHEHSLFPLKDSYRVRANHDKEGTTFSGPLIFSHPTLFKKALFIPHIREHATMEGVLQSQIAQQDATAVFCHADVKGAYMNDLVVSLGGVPPIMFPPNKLIYSGHFHKPHVVHGSNKLISVEYLGSPYQVSLAEAHQDKALAVVDSDNGWQCIERIALNLGRKHYRIDSIESFLSLCTNAVNVPQLAENIDLINTPSITVSSGDRVVMSINEDVLENYRRQSSTAVTELDKHAMLLRQAGVAVEIRPLAKDHSNSMWMRGTQKSSDDNVQALLEDLSPTSIWRTFLLQEVERDALSNATATSLLSAGLELLQDIGVDDDEGSDQKKDKLEFGVDSMESSMKELEIESLTVEGFGPFRSAVTYPLLDRGLVHLRGSNLDGGSDSNGSGKTSLVMASLWCLTGSLDPRPLEDSKVVDLVNDASKTARVTVRGCLNGETFTITRTKTSSKSGLVFILDGKDLTTQSVKETQVLVEEKLGINSQLLARTIFHGQHALNDLLESSDTHFKSELSLLVPLQLWQDALSIARKRERVATKSADELQGMWLVRNDDLTKLRKKLEYELVEIGVLEKSFQECKTRQSEGFDDTTQLREIMDKYTSLEFNLRSQLKSRDEELNELQLSLDDLEKNLNLAKEICIQLKNDRCLSLRDEAKEKLQKLESTWQLDLSAGRPNLLVLPEKCPTCQQSLSDNEHSDEFIRKNLKTNITEAINSLVESQIKLDNHNQLLEEAMIRQRKAQISYDTVHEKFNNKKALWTRAIRATETTLSATRAAYQEVSARIATSSNKGLKDNLEDVRSQFLNKKSNLNRTKAELKDLEAALDDLELRKDEQLRKSFAMNELSSALGPRGVQTFVLQNAVEILQYASQAYLDDLSDGLLRLEMSLDSGDRILRRAFVRESDGLYKARPLAALSGGQWRRCSLALSLGFAELTACRGKLRSSLLILDEPLTHLDRTGRASVGQTLKRLIQRRTRTTTRGKSESPGSFGSLSLSTVIVILQDLAAEELEDAFDCTDEVVKEHGSSFVRVDVS